MHRRKNNRPSLSLRPYLTFLFTKHHVVPGSSALTFEEVINAVVGVHSARLPTPYVAFHARMPGMSPRDYRHATFRENRLIKLRCMRKTLHTVNRRLAPVVHMATLRLRTVELRNKLFAHFRSEIEFAPFLTTIAETLRYGPCSHKQLLLEIADTLRRRRRVLTRADSKILSRLFLKWAWENGFICYLNHAEHWSNEQRYYGSMHVYYPDIQFPELSFEEAVEELVRNHIAAYGPVSVADIAWWSGLGKSAIRKAVEGIGDLLMRVDLEGVEQDLLMLKSDFSDFLRHVSQTDRSDWCAFLAYEDPTLKGYFTTRSRYVERQHYSTLFNQIGEVRASVVCNGRTEGVWKWDSKHRKVQIQWFGEPPKRHIHLVRRKQRELEAFLDESAQVNGD